MWFLKMRYYLFYRFCELRFWLFCEKNKTFGKFGQFVHFLKFVLGEIELESNRYMESGTSPDRYPLRAITPREGQTNFTL